MSNRSRTLRRALTVAALLFTSFLANAADDDFEFAQALAQRGYTELAETQFRALLNDPKRNAAEKAEGQYGLALIKHGEARREALQETEARRQPLAAVLALFDGADKELEEFLSRNATHPRALEAKLSRATLQTERAKYIDTAVERNWVPPDVDQAKLRESVALGYDTAIKLLKAVQDGIQKRLSTLSPSDDKYDETQDENNLVWLHRISALYGKGAALPQGDAGGMAALNQVLTEVEGFLWDNEGTVRGLWGFYFSGLANWKLGNSGDAMRDLRSAATSVKESEGIPAARSVVMTAYEKTAEVGIDLSEREGSKFLMDAANLLATLPETWPSYLDDMYGQRAALARARVMARAGNPAQAIELVQTVIRKAEEKGTYVDNDAGRVLSELISGGDTGNAMLDQHLLEKIADSKWAAEDYRGAIKSYQAVIAACEGDPIQMDEHSWNAWEKVGNSYYSLGRLYEAFLAYDYLQRAFRKDNTNDTLEEVTNRTGFLRAQAIDGLAKVTTDKVKAKDLFALSKKLIDEFAADNPNSPRNQDAKGSAFSTKLSELKQAARTGDMMRARALADEARKLAAGIEKDSKSIDRVQAELASIHLYLEEFAEGIAKSQAWLDAKRADTLDRDVARARIQGEAIALSTLLNCRARTPDTLESDAKKSAFQDVLDAMDKYGAQYEKVTTRGKTQMDQWRIEALNALGKVDEADQLLAKLLAADPNNRNAPYLAYLVARAREREGAEWETKGDMTRARSKRLRAAMLFEFSVVQGAKLQGREPSPGSYRTLAVKFRKANELDKAEGHFQTALSAYEAAGEADSADAVRIELIGLFIDRGKYDEAIGPLEKKLVDDDTSRAGVIANLSAGTGKLTNVDIQQLWEVGMTKNKGVIDTLSRAYFEAGREAKELIRSINLINLLQYSHKKDDRHNEEWIEWRLREVKAYYKLGDAFGSGDSFKVVVTIVQNGIITPGLIDQYDETLPGSKAEFERLLQNAKAKL